MNSAARLVCSSSRYEHITPLLCQLHWLKAAERIDYKLALLVYKCRQGVTPPYLADELCHAASRHRSSISSAFRLDIITDCPPYAAVNRRWPSFSSRRPSYLEQSTAARHVSTVTGHLSQSPKDSSLQALLSMTSPFSSRAREVTYHYGHVNRFYYLLTYLLTYLLFIFRLHKLGIEEHAHAHITHPCFAFPFALLCFALID